MREAGANDLGAEEALLQELPVIFSVSKKQETIRTTPGVVSILTREDIDHLGVRTIAEALAFVPGMTAYHSFYGEFNQFAVRGNLGGDHANAKTLFLVDDHPVFDALTGGYEVNSIPISNVERIEVVRGPVSVTYGTNALTGVIRIITRRPKNDKALEGEARYTGGGYRKYHQGELFLGHASDESVRWSASAAGVSDGGYPVMLVRGRSMEGTAAPATYSHNMWDRNMTGSTSVGYKGLETSARYWRGDAQPLIGAAPLFVNRYTYWGKRTFSGDASQTIGLGDLGQARVLLRFDRFDGTAYQPPTAAGISNSTSWGNNKWGSEAYVNLAPTRALDLLAGAAYDRYYNTEFLSTSGNASSTMSDLRISDTAGYASAQLKVADPLKLTAGTRYSENTTSGAHWDYQGGALYDVSQKWMVKALFGTSYRAPNFQELYFRAANVTLGNSLLESEILKGADLVLLYTASHVTGQVTAYWNRTVNMIKRVPTGNGNEVKYQNTPGEESKGVEWELKRSHLGRFTLWLQGAHIFDAHELDDAATPGIAMLVVENSASVGANTDFLNKKLHVSAGARYSDHWGRAESYWTTNATVRYRVYKGAELTLQGTNVFNKTYEYPEFSRQRIAVMPGGAPREVTGGVQVNF